jgi:hypothetical protein
MKLRLKFQPLIKVGDRRDPCPASGFGILSNFGFRPSDFRKPLLGLLLLSLCGCIKIKDELILNADGSGQVQLETVSSLPPEYAAGMGMAGQMGGAGGGLIYPPVNESEARKFFPRKDFNVTVHAQKAANGDVTNVVQAEFKNLSALLASPYGRAHQLSVSIADGSLVVRALTGMEATARFAEITNNPAMGMDFGLAPALAGLRNKTNNLRAEFRLTLPNAIASATAAHEGRTATWVVERAQSKDADDFARQLGAVCEARCPAAGLKMTPVTPVRLGLRPFAELAAGVADAGAAVDTNKIAAAAKFVPYGLVVTRSLDLSGEGGAQESGAQLTGAVVVPPEFEPQKWGEPKLDEVVDAKGNDLKPGEGGEGRAFARPWSSGLGGADEEDNESTNPPQHVITISFRAPDWKVNEIARLKGSLTMQYYGGSQVVKLTNAIPTDWITDVSNLPGGMMGGRFDESTAKPINSAALAGLGLSLSAQTCVAQSGLTMLTLQVQGQQAALTDAQVFDAGGRPWPTIFPPQGFGGGGGGDDDSESLEIIVAGKPKPPLSLAFVASGNGAAAPVPILLEHVSISR